MTSVLFIIRWTLKVIFLRESSYANDDDDVRGNIIIFAERFNIVIIPRELDAYRDNFGMQRGLIRNAVEVCFFFMLENP